MKQVVLGITLLAFAAVGFHAAWISPALGRDVHLPGDVTSVPGLNLGQGSYFYPMAVFALKIPWVQLAIVRSNICGP